MTAKTFLTIVAVVAVLYGLAFVLIPELFNALYGIPPEPHIALYARFFGSALIGIAIVNWVAKDFRETDAIRGVLIADVVVTVIGGILALFAVISGLANALAWTSVLVYALLLIGAVYCLSQGAQRA